jgi:hypothetical protein
MSAAGTRVTKAHEHEHVGASARRYGGEGESAEPTATEPGLFEPGFDFEAADADAVAAAPAAGGDHAEEAPDAHDDEVLGSLRAEVVMLRRQRDGAAASMQQLARGMGDAMRCGLMMRRARPAPPPLGG